MSRSATPRQVADDLLERARREPDLTLRLATELSASARTDTELRVVSEHAAVLARIELGQLTAAFAQSRRLLTVAHRAGLADQVAELHLTCAWIELDRGNRTAGWTHLDAAQPRLRGTRLARARCLRGLSLCAAGQYADALAELNPAVDGLRRYGDRHWLANALVGRGTVHGYLPHTHRADADFRAAAALFAELDEPIRAAACVHNRGFVALTAGDLPQALRHFADAEHEGLSPNRHPEALVDRAQTLMAAGLVDEARGTLSRAARLLTGSGRGTKLAEALVTVAHCAVYAGDAQLAASTAAQASVLFGRQRRSGWLAASRAVSLIAALRLGATATSSAVTRAAQRCDRHGWWLLAAELRLAATPQPANRHLIELARHRRHGPAALRTLGWLARARLAQTSGNRRGVLAACRAGLSVMDHHVTSIGAWELQAGVFARAVELAGLGLSAAVDGGRPRTVLRWTDRHRAAAFSRPAVLPPPDPRLAQRLAELRSAVATEAGQPSSAGRRRVLELERDVRGQDWTHAGPAVARTDWRTADLVDALGETALVSYAVDRGQVVAVSVVDGRFRVHDIAPEAEVSAAVRTLRFAALLSARGDSATGRRAGDRATAELDQLLFDPVSRQLADRRLVVVPTGPLHALPWAALPTCVGRAVSAVPSVAGWLRATRIKPDSDPDSRDRVWVAGPGLAHAEAEVRSLHAAHGGRMLAGADGTVAGAMSALSEAGIAHIAAHGRFRADQPLFSCLELADGPLYGYDLQRSGRPPRCIVLSACDAGLSVVRPGDEVIGFAAALLRGGTSAVIASVLPVPDEPVVGLMTALHAGLRAGLTPAVALARAQTAHGHLGFVCLGAG